MNIIADLFYFMLITIFYFITLIVLSITGAIIAGPPNYFKHPVNGSIKVVRKGFSFTYLFFGAFVPLFRGHFKSFAIALILDLLSLSLFRFVYVFFINKSYADYLVSQGYEQFNPYDVNETIEEVIDIQ